MQPSAIWCAAFVAAAAVSMPLPAPAQQQAPESAYAAASPDDVPATDPRIAEWAAAPNELPSGLALGQAINIDPASLASDTQPKALRLPGAQSASADPNWNRSDRPDGSASISVKKPVEGWDAKVGADFALPPAAVTSYNPAKPLPGTVSKDPGSGAAWANVDVPEMATLELRAEPSPDQSKLGTLLQRSVPVGDNFSLTLQNAISVTESFAGASAVAPTPALGQAASILGAAPTRVWGSEQVVKFNFLTSGTTFAAGTSHATNDPMLHNKFSAQQQIYGPLNVTTAVTDFGKTTSAKSVTAGVKLAW